MSLDTEDVVALYERHSDELLGFLAHRTGDRQLARDLLGDTFLSAFAARGQCRADEEAQRLAWLYRIAANKLYENSRRRTSERRALWRLGLGSEQPAGSCEPGYERVEQLDEASQLQPELNAAVAQLSEEQAQAIRSRVIEERDYAQAAAQLGVGEDAVRARVSRGLRALRRAIGGSAAVGLAILLLTDLTGGSSPRQQAPRGAPAAPVVGMPQASPAFAPRHGTAPSHSAAAARANATGEPHAAHRQRCSPGGRSHRPSAHSRCGPRGVSRRR